MAKRKSNLRGVKSREVRRSWVPDRDVMFMVCADNIPKSATHMLITADGDNPEKIVMGSLFSCPEERMKDERVAMRLLYACAFAAVKMAAEATGDNPAALAERMANVYRVQTEPDRIRIRKEGEDD